MIKLYVNNNRTIEITQDKADGLITVSTINSSGEIERKDGIDPGDMVMLLNYYRYQKDNGNEIF